MYISGGFTRRYLSRVLTRSITTKRAAATASPIPMNIKYSRTRYRSMMCVESRGPRAPCRRHRRRSTGTARRTAASVRHTAGIAGHRHSRAVAIRSPSPTSPNNAFGAQMAMALGILALSAAPSSDVIMM